MGVNRDDQQGGLNRTRKRRPPKPRTKPLAQVGPVEALQPATVTAFHGNPAKPIRRYKPAYQGEKPAGYEPVPQYGQFGRPLGNQLRPYYQTPVDKRTGMERAVDAQVTPLLASAPRLASPALTVPATIAGTALANLGGGPAALSAADYLKQHQAGHAAVELSGLLPIGRLGKLVKGAKAGIDAAEATNAARSAEDVLLAGMKGVPRKRATQEALRSQERGKRAAAYNAALKNGNGIAAHRQALAQLKGELPKINYDGFQELTPDALDHLVNVVRDHPHLMPFQKATLIEALDKSTHGNLPTPSEQKLIEHVFGKETADGFKQLSGMPAHLQNAVAEVLNVPRSLMASFDMSAPLRQGLVAHVRHPVVSSKNWPAMVKAFGSEKSYQSLMDSVRSRPTYPMMQAAKLAITDVEGVGNREEQFFSNLAEKMTGGKKSPVRMSGRAYTGFLVKTRADIFDQLLRSATASGVNIQDEKFLRDLGRHINALTGRGELPGKVLKQSAPFWNSVFFSPRLLASRVHFLNPATYLDPRTDPFVRKEELKSLLALTGTAGTILGALAALPGVKVNTDPRNADFGKVRVGNTRVDILGGFQQPIRLVSQLMDGKVISSTTGKTLTLGPEGPGNLSRYDIATRFVQGKLAPVPAVITDWFKGTDFADKPFSWKREMVQHMIPLLAQDATDIYNQPVNGMNGIEAALAGYGVGAFGVGIQTYGAKPDESYRQGIAAIDQAVKQGELSAEEAKSYKQQLDRQHFLATHDTPENRRQYLIDEMRQQGSSLDDINQALHALNYEPVQP